MSLCRVFVMLLAFIASGSYAYSRMGEAEVRDDDGAPCFTVTKKEEKRADGKVLFQAISISDRTVKPAVEVWGFGTEPAGRRQFITNAECYRYGEIPVGAAGEVAPPLQPGRLYSVGINAHPEDSTDPTHFYSARFCLAPLANGKVKIFSFKAENFQDYTECQFRTPPAP
jgi:hypothetical protein